MTKKFRSNTAVPIACLEDILLAEQIHGSKSVAISGILRFTASAFIAGIEREEDWITGFDRFCDAWTDGFDDPRTFVAGDYGEALAHVYTWYVSRRARFSGVYV